MPRGQRARPPPHPHLLNPPPPSSAGSSHPARVRLPARAVTSEAGRLAAGPRREGRTPPVWTECAPQGVGRRVQCDLAKRCRSRPGKGAPPLVRAISFVNELLLAGVLWRFVGSLDCHLGTRINTPGRGFKQVSSLQLWPRHKDLYGRPPRASVSGAGGGG